MSKQNLYFYKKNSITNFVAKFKQTKNKLVFIKLFYEHFVTKNPISRICIFLEQIVFTL